MPDRDWQIGTCGIRGRQAQAFAELDMVEIQKTFYQPPRVGTAEKWRARAPDGFVFALKAWQLITHESTSPTYRRLSEPLSREELASVGSFRWNAVTTRAWERTRDIARALRAETVVFQTPRHFRPSDDNLRRLERFFRAIERDGRVMVFEPRGKAWDDDIVARLCHNLDVVHGVDPFLRSPPRSGLQYLRLHGRPAYNYRYAYSNDDLSRLVACLDARRPARILFNNDRMAEDARRLREFVRKMA